MAEPQEPQSPITGALGSLIEQRTKVISAAHSPLGFFVLALLIVEVFLICGGAFFSLPLPYKLAALGIGIFLFLVVFTTVTVLVVKLPQNLVFGEESHINFARMQRFGSDQQSVSARDLVDMRPTAPPQIPVQPVAELPPPPPPAPQDEQGGNQ